MKGLREPGEGASRTRELLGLGALLGAVAAVASALCLPLTELGPPRWSSLPWGLVPDALVVVLERGSSGFRWLAMGLWWGLTAALAWRWRARRGETGAGARLAFDATALLVGAIAVGFARDFFAWAPGLLRLHAGSNEQWPRYLTDAVVLGAAVFGVGLVWRPLARVVGGAGSLLVAVSAAAWLPFRVGAAAGHGLLARAVSAFPEAAVLGVALGAACATGLFYGLLRASARRSQGAAAVWARCVAGVGRPAAAIGAVGAAVAAVVAASLGVGFPAPSGPEPPADAPNLALVVVDTLRADHLGAWGYPKPTSPHFDAWARRGSVFRRAYSVSSFTSPGTAGILSSRYPSELGIESNNSLFPSWVPTLATLLSERGYSTAAFVSNFILRRETGFHRGFQIYDDWFPAREAIRGLGERPARKATDSAIRWLDHRDPSRPFFLWVHYQDPHGPYLPPPDFGRRFEARDYPGVRDVPASRIPAYQVVDGVTDARALVAGYDNEIGYWDEHFARLLERLGREDGARPTYVVFTADHGEILDEPREISFGHSASLTEEQLHVPLVFAGPGIAAGRVLTEPVSSLDVLPTVLSLLGIAPPGGAAFRGVDLVPVLRGERPADPGRVVVSEFPRPGGTLRVSARGAAGAAELGLPEGAVPRSEGALPPEAAPDPLRGALARHRAFVDLERTRGVEVELDRSDLDRLQALGYVE